LCNSLRLETWGRIFTFQSVRVIQSKWSSQNGHIKNHRWAQRRWTMQQQVGMLPLHFPLKTFI
jgi:hypothetical protein